MKSFELATEKKGVVLRQLASESDDLAYFNAVESNRDHLSQFGDETAIKYPDIDSVREARINPSAPDKLRLGIWNEGTFIGSINLTPDKHGAAEIGYWLDDRYSGQGYATIATKALARYSSKKYTVVYAKVSDENSASRAVLERAGFQLLTQEIGHSIFGVMGIDKPEILADTEQLKETRGKPLPLDLDSKNTKVTTNIRRDQDLEMFAEFPSRKNALRAIDQEKLTVFLSLGIAKKLYRCPCCRGSIDTGRAHVILSRVQMSKQYSHHHIHFQCIQDKVLPTLKGIKIIKSDEASASAVNARRRRYRNRMRRKQKGTPI